MSCKPLFDTVRIGDIELSSRIAMAPLTRARASDDCVPSPLAKEYYRQRASAGLIIAEATQISAEAQGYSCTPGIHTPQQVAAWKDITAAVHDEGGRIFLQLWHTGRVSNIDVQPGGRAPKAPSAVRAVAQTWVNGGFLPCSEPVAMTQADIDQVVRDFAQASSNAVEAGFDGVEIHAANGYLIDQFLRDGANQRTDEYGGSIANRLRFLEEVLTAVTAAIGGGRTGIRISPVSTANGIADSEPVALFSAVAKRLNQFGLAYLHIIEGITRGPREDGPPFDWRALHTLFEGPTIANNGFNAGQAAEHISSGHCDLVAFGRDFISNPDLVARIKAGKAIAPADPATFYGGDAQGYTDYPFL